ncbi:MAG TPA: SCO family protein [Tepidisphaeraceae bacterium]|nr:SCO family protein [Tepidisphaeraceae bacterium]
MRRNQKIFVTILWGAAVLAMLGVVGAGIWIKRPDVPANVLFNAPVFSLTDQDGKTISDANLRGNVWVADVFFTSCPGVCPIMEAKLVELQKAVKLPVLKIVSLSIDPEHDTPDVMKQYANGLGADQSRWYFLTGSKDQVFATARGFNLAAQPAQGGNAIVHTQKVLLIDQQNQVRGIYDTNDDESMKKLAEDAKALAAS